MSQLARFFEYVQEFELAYATDDFARIERFFGETAHHRVSGCRPLAVDSRGRKAAVTGLRQSVRRIDRRFDTRIPEILDGPLVREDGIWMRFGLRLRRTGLPDLVLEGEHLVVYDREGRIAGIEERMLDGCDARAAAFLADHDAELHPIGCEPRPPRAEDAALLRDALQRSLVRAYGHAKSHQDVEASLALCHPDFGIDTVPFGLASHGLGDTEAQLRLFFSVFPDYRADTEGLAAGEAGVAWWGRISLTFAGAFFGNTPTGRSAEIPAVSIFEFRDGRIARERFQFDLGALCAGIGLPVEDLTHSLRGLRAAA